MPASDYDTSPFLAYENPSLGSPAMTISDILLILRRGWRLPLLGCLIGLTAAAAYVLIAPKLYTSTARILIDRSVNRFLQANKILDEPAFDDSESGSQVYVLSSESIILPIVRSMDLAHDPEFVGRFHDRGAEQPWGIRKVAKWAMRTAGLEAEPSLEPEAALERTAVETFMKRLSVYREDVPGVITVSFASKDAEKAARITNTILDSYLESTSDAKLKSTRIASQLLQDRLIELKQSLVSANSALQDFKLANNLVAKGTGLRPTEQIPALTTQLTTARTQLAEAKTRLERIQQQMSSESASGTIFPDSQVITGLRSKYLDLSARAAELASRVGSDHLAVVKLRKEMNEAQIAIRDEEKRLAAIYAGAYEAALTKSNELAAMLGQLSLEANKESQAQITMRELEVKVDSLRDLYNSVLEKSNTLNIQPLNPVQDARIITRAAPQLYRSSKKVLVLGGGVLLGLLVGVAGVIARELAAGVFRTPEQVKQATGIYCVSVPTVEGNGKQKGPPRTGKNSMLLKKIVLDAPYSIFKESFSNMSAPIRELAYVKQAASTHRLGGGPAFEANGEQIASLQANTNSMLLEEFVVDAPHSRFTESFRGIKVLVDASQRACGDKVLGIVSAVAGNGKSTIATNLAALMAASARTLVIDGDLHRRQLTLRLEPGAREGLIEALDDPSRFADLVLTRPRSGFDFLPCVLAERIPNAAQLLGSPKMERLLNAARNSYDYIIVECPPVMSVVDVKVIERFVEKFVFVIEWGKTKRRVVQEALDEYDNARERTLCFVLNKIDPSALRSIEAYKGLKYLDYYTLTDREPETKGLPRGE